MPILNPEGKSFETEVDVLVDLTGSVASLGLVILAQGFPMTIVSLFGGVLADRYDRRNLLIAAQAVSEPG